MYRRPPELPVGDPWPSCGICGDEMVLFFNIRLPELAQSPFIPASRLQVFACREHDDVTVQVQSTAIGQTRTQLESIAVQATPYDLKVKWLHLNCILDDNAEI